MIKKECVYFHYASTINSSFMYKKLGLNIPTNIFYIGDETGEYFYVPVFEYDYLKKYSRHPGIRNINELKGFENNYFNAVTDFLKQKKKTIIVPAFFPAWLLEKMLKRGINVEVKDFYFFQPLLNKSAKEIEMIRKTAKGVRDCFDYIENVLAETTSQNNFIYYKGKKLSSKLLSNMIGLFLLSRNIKCEILIVAYGKYAYYPHCQINHFLEPKKTIIVDLGAMDTDNGYYVDVSRTYCIGKPESEKFIDLYNCVKKAKSKLKEKAFPGKLISTAYSEAVSVMSEQGIKIARNSLPFKDDTISICHHSLGHGVGRELHQLPIIDENAVVGFEKNMVLAFELGAYMKGYGGVRIEDTYLITENGVENLTRGKYNFLINQE